MTDAQLRRAILAFLRSWLVYSNACVKAHRKGVQLPTHDKFKPFMGLCNCSETDHTTDDYHFRRELRNLFKEDRLCTIYPFGKRSFSIRWDTNTQVLQPSRRRWVKATILKLEKELGNA